MISLDNLTVSYGGWTLFDNISLLINPKDRIGLVGKNGAGKTTLLRLIVGEQQPTSGSISYNGECTIGYLPQQMRVADTTTLVEETAKAFDEVLRLEAEIESLTRQIAERTDYESASYEQLLHRLNDANDLLYRDGGYEWFNGKRIDNPNTHGTGCTLSSAIASNLAKGYDLDTAVERAKAYISGCLSAMLDLGHGSGPMDHTFNLKGDFVRD